MTPCFPLRLARTTTRFTCSQAPCRRKLQTEDKNRFYIYCVLCTYTRAHTLILNKMGKKHTTHALWTVNMSVSGAELTAGGAWSSVTEASGGWADGWTDGRPAGSLTTRSRRCLRLWLCFSLRLSAPAASSQHVAWSRVLPAAASRPFSSCTGRTFL